MIFIGSNGWLVLFSITKNAASKATAAPNQVSVTESDQPNSPA